MVEVVNKKACGKTHSFGIKDLSEFGKPIRLPFVKNVRSKGRLYYYFSTADGLKRLPDESPQSFLSEYQREIEARERPQTIPALIARYECSPDYNRLSDNTQGLYDHCFRKLCGAHPRTEIDGFSFGELERFAEAAKSKGTATTYIKVISALFSWAKREGYAGHNPADGMIARRRGEQWIYFIGTSHGEPVKIGRTSSVRKRLAAIQNGNHRRLHVLASFKTADPLEAEAQYHSRFAEHRLHGEWFEPHADILAEITRLTNERNRHGTT